MGENVDSMSKRVASSCPHHPANLVGEKVKFEGKTVEGSFEVRDSHTTYLGSLMESHFSCKNIPAIPPGPEFRYL